MLHKTRGIVLHHLKYTDTSVIAHIYTEKFGRQSYIFSGIRSKKSKGKINYLQPMSLLDLEVYYKPKSNIQRISEFRPAYTYKSVPFSVVKQTILIFLAEILYKSLKEEESNPGLFEYLFSSIQYFDTIEKGESDFHLLFLIQLSRFLGFYPSTNYDNANKYFDLREGLYFPEKANLAYRLDANISRLIYLLCGTSFKELGNFNLKGSERKVLLYHLVEYYQHHLIAIKSINSLDVLKEVFED